METASLIDFDPLCSKSAESYVESVMSPNVHKITVTADVHDQTVSNNSKANISFGQKRALDDLDKLSESAKKMKPNNHRTTDIDTGKNSDINELKSMVESLTYSMNNMCISLTDRINKLEQNMTRDLAVLIEKKVKHEIGQVKQEINGTLSNFQSKVNSLEAKVNTFEKSYATVAKQSVNEDKKLNIVIKGVNTGKNETNNTQ